MSGEQEAPATRRSLPRRIINRLEIDRATFYALLSRCWQVFGGAVSALLIARFFTSDVQGYHYTFVALMAAQLVFELGFSVVITNLASHEWAGLTLNETGEIVENGGSLSRLVSLGRFVFKWYAVAATLFIVGVGSGGALFLSRQPTVGIDWIWPWITLTVAGGLNLWTAPFLSLLEGCRQIAVVNRYRLKQAVLANVAAWTTILLGGNLWAIVAVTVMRLLVDLYVLLVRYRRFFRAFFQLPTGERIDWRTDIRPMQSRLAVSGVMSYFAFWLFTPVLMEYQSPSVAGQMGMSWQLIIALQMSALAWVHSRVPRFGELIARREFGELDRVFFRVTIFSSAAVVVGAVFGMAVVWGLNVGEFSFADRLLPPLPFGLFVLATVLYHFPNCQSLYLRAHKREPFLWSTVIASLLIAGLTWFLGSRYGAIGAGAGYLAVTALFVLPVQTAIWLHCRQTWHTEESS